MGTGAVGDVSGLGWGREGKAGGGSCEGGRLGEGGRERVGGRRGRALGRRGRIWGRFGTSLVGGRRQRAKRGEVGGRGRGGGSVGGSEGGSEGVGRSEGRSRVAVACRGRASVGSGRQLLAWGEGGMRN